MCQFIETICYEKGDFQHIGLHNERCNRTRRHFFGALPDVDLHSDLHMPEHLKNKTVKCKVTYGRTVTSIGYTSYQIRPVNSLRIIRDDTIEYSFKYADRTILNLLFELRGQCDDILIVKNGFITDTSYANIIFQKDKRWYSPINPLLHGTRLDNYIRKGCILPAQIRQEDLPGFSEARIINAMISIDSSPIIPIQNLIR